MTFRILAQWTEEYKEDGGGIFCDEDNDSGALRLNVLTFASKTLVTTRTAMSLLEAPPGIPGTPSPATPCR